MPQPAAVRRGKRSQSVRTPSHARGPARAFKGALLVDDQLVQRAAAVLLRRAAAALRRHAPRSRVLRDLAWWCSPHTVDEGQLERLARAYVHQPVSAAVQASHAAQAEVVSQHLAPASADPRRSLASHPCRATTDSGVRELQVGPPPRGARRP